MAWGSGSFFHCRIWYHLVRREQLLWLKQGTASSCLLCSPVQAMCRSASASACLSLELSLSPRPRCTLFRRLCYTALAAAKAVSPNTLGSLNLACHLCSEISRGRPEPAKPCRASKCVGTCRLNEECCLHNGLVTQLVAFLGGYEGAGTRQVSDSSDCVGCRTLH